MNTSLLYHISDCQYTVCAIWIEIRQYGLVCGDTSHGRDYGDIPKNICSSVPVSKILRRLTNLETALLKLSDKVGQCQWQNDSSVETRNSWFCFSIPQQQSLHFVSFPRYCTVRFRLQITNLHTSAVFHASLSVILSELCSHMGWWYQVTKLMAHFGHNTGRQQMDTKMDILPQHSPC